MHVVALLDTDYEIARLGTLGLEPLMWLFAPESLKSLHLWVV
jgi:hypothetical protein